MTSLSVADTGVEHFTVDRGHQIRSRRERLGITRRELADAAGASASMLRQLEAGYLPKRSAVAPRIEATLALLEHENAAATPADDPLLEWLVGALRARCGKPDG